MLMYDRTVALADELGLRDQTVFFNDAWVPYAERQDYLLEADIGVSTHYESIETLFAFRTRLLDYLWAGLPMIVSSGDTLSELVAEHGLGYVVAPGDVEGLAAAILKLADEPDRRERRAAAMAAVREQFTWERTLEPLVNFCRNPYHAADALLRRPHGAARPRRRHDLADRPGPAHPELDKIVAEKNAAYRRAEAGHSAARERPRDAGAEPRAEAARAVVGYALHILHVIESDAYGVSIERNFVAAMDIIAMSLAAMLALAWRRTNPYT